MRERDYVYNNTRACITGSDVAFRRPLCCIRRRRSSFVARSCMPTSACVLRSTCCGGGACVRHVKVLADM